MVVIRRLIVSILIYKLQCFHLYSILTPNGKIYANVGDWGLQTYQTAKI